MKNSWLLYVGIALIGLGILKPNLLDLSNINNPLNNNSTCVENYIKTPPVEKSLLEKCNLVIDILQTSNASNKKVDLLKLSSLYADIAILIRLDGNDVVVKDTQSIKQVNGLSGSMLRLDIKDKYPDLAQACQNVLLSAIGDDDTILTSDSRTKAADAFDGLSWAFYEGSK